MRLIAQMKNLDAASLVTKALIQAARQGMEFGVSDGAQIAVEEAKLQCPVDTGALREAIHVEPLVNEPERLIVNVVPAYAAGNKYGFEPPYARRVHNGFTGPDSLGRIYQQAPNPYMLRAAEAAKSAVIKAIKEGITESVNEAGQKAYRR
jgi:hypothetical protein